LASLLLLSACGYKGPLTLPPDEQASAQTAAQNSA